MKKYYQPHLSPKKFTCRTLPRRRYALILALALCLGLGRGVSTGYAKPIAIEVDAGRPLGDMPYIYRTGVVWWFPPNSAYIRDKFFAEHKPGAVRLSLDAPVISPSRSLEHLGQLLSHLDKVALAVADKGGELTVCINAMPRWLSASQDPSSANPEYGYGPVWSVSPPRDYDMWARTVQTIAEHFSRKLGISARYVIWNEPDWLWRGSLEEYFKLYKYSVLGIKRAAPQAQIGGPSVSNWQAPPKSGPRSSRSFIYNFIKYASQTPLPELGLKRLPLDFISWNQYSADPLVDFEKSAGSIRKWLAEFGYTDTMLIQTEWNFRSEPLFSQSYINDNHIGAAFVLASLYGMEQAGIQRMTFQGIQDSLVYQKSLPAIQRAKLPDKEFFGYTGMFTKHGVIKPSYNAFRLVSMLGKERLAANWNDPFITAVASREANRLSVLIANFIPPHKMIMHRAAKLLRDKGFNKQSLGLLKEKSSQLLNNPRLINTLPFSDSQKRDIKGVYQLLSLHKQRQENPVSLKIEWQKLPYTDKFKCRVYLVDSRHSNSYKLRDQVEAQIKNATPEGLNKAGDFLKKKGFSQESIQRLKQAYTQGLNLKRISQSLTPGEKQQAKKALELFEETFCSKIKQINESPPVKLEPAQQKVIAAGDYCSHELNLEPNGVCLVVLSP